MPRLLLAFIFALAPATVLAGMPSPELILTELGKRRLDELSFFLLGFLLTTAIVRWLWNYLRGDFPSLPRLSYRRALAGMALWGLVMTVVLTLISGARELMTPAAWEPNGVTYKLKSSSAEMETAVSEILSRRRRRLDDLRFALFQFAATHEGRFPTDDEKSSIPDETWSVETGGGTKFIYRPGLNVKSIESILIYEPEIYDGGQLVLMTSGRIALLKEISSK